ncbi:lysophospholipid acyltransferase family protein [Fluviibacterium sp. DFM31]|uniref:Lysophospholipid acyltransferase family protein n=1 Tax=Meridianimarinicoccus marinus TaxID=3231483 RepID=A0ABV3L2E4_9RHOB
MYLMMAVLAVIYTPWALFDRRGAFAGIRAYCRYVRWTAGWMIGLKSEIRGEVPRDEVMIASKHQSFFDIIMICSVVPRPKFIMKKQLVRAPILGWYALRIGCVPVDRGKRGPAMEQMVRDVAAGRSAPGQLIIYPQGTRVAPRATMPYKIGTGVLYRKLGQPCVPAATNVGVFWPRSGVLRKPGTAVVEFLDPIPPGQEIEPFMAALEEVVEARSRQLMVEAGLKFDAT